MRLDDDLLAEVKQHALQTRRTLTETIRDALIALLERERSLQSPRRIHLTVFRGDGVFDGVDIDHNAGLLYNMECD